MSLKAEIEAPKEEISGAFEELAELWQGEWGPVPGGGRLVLPVQAGLRRGIALIEVRIETTEGGLSRIALEIVEEQLRLNRGAVAVLALGALGGLLTIVWPLHPDLLRLAPVGALLAVVAWLMVASRFRSHGPQEFLDLIVEAVAPKVEP
jgi:hypothetical protein